MSEIAIDEVMRKLGLTYDEVKAVVDEVASADIKGMATKLDIAELKAELKTDIAKLDTKIERSLRYQIMWMVGIGIAAIGVLKFL